MTFNAFQQHAASTFEGGAFSHFTSKDDVDACGNSLFRFIMTELSDAEDCADTGDAVGRLALAVGQLNEVLRGMKQVTPSQAPAEPLTETTRLYLLHRLFEEARVRVFRLDDSWTYTVHTERRILDWDAAIRAAADANLVFLPDWDVVTGALGLDESFAYTAQQQREYIDQYLLAEYVAIHAIEGMIFLPDGSPSLGGWTG
ncbi:hypothetical protein [Noviherbaspirillum galbum]|uniref:Uncharacterized protein n=1 Tax=Noviherbaspirillum galbum TaxID=2709383 RepID=A0A6B3SN27_9BURK|nr:hypothetical protein [Noviherbaspirillum galbum]NEX60156.1 hypothetical protein [Noviherbaspirillum galbum]